MQCECEFSYKFTSKWNELNICKRNLNPEIMENFDIAFAKKIVTKFEFITIKNITDESVQQN